MSFPKFILLLALSSIFDTSFSLKNHFPERESKLRTRHLGDGSGSAKCDKFSSRKFIEHAGSDLVIFNTEEGKLNPGDITVWNNHVYDSDSVDKKGSIQGFCTFLPELVYECSITLRLDHGSIMMQGSFLDNPDVLAIVGGTHCYEGMEGGEVRVTASYNGNPERTQYKVMVNY